MRLPNDFQVGLVYPEPIETTCETAFEVDGDCLLELTTDCIAQFNALSDSAPIDSGTSAQSTILRLAGLRGGTVFISRIATTSDCATVSVHTSDTAVDELNVLMLEPLSTIDLELKHVWGATCQIFLEIDSNAQVDDSNGGTRILTVGWR